MEKIRSLFKIFKRQAQPPENVAAIDKANAPNPAPHKTITAPVIKDHVVTIRFQKQTKAGLKAGQGSGFLIAPNIIITAWHVLEGAKKGSIKFSTGEEAQILAGHRDSKKDIAVILLDRPLSAKPVRFSKKPLQIKDPVFAGANMVNPLASEPGFGIWETDRGVFAGINPLCASLNQFMFRFTKVRQGYSGTPIFNQQGEVISMAHSIDTFKKDPDNPEVYAFTASLEEIKNTLRSALHAFRRKGLLPHSDQGKDPVLHL